MSFIPREKRFNSNSWIGLALILSLVAFTGVFAQAQTTAPSFVSFNPASPANSDTLTVTVQNDDADPVTLTLYADSACNTPIDSQTGVASGGTAGLQDNNVPQDASTEYFVTADDGSSGVSACTSMGTFTEDSTPPTPSISSSETSPTNASPIPVSVDFGEPVSGFDQGDLIIGNGAVGGFSDDGGGLFSFDLTPSSDGSVTVDINAGVAQDNAGNDNNAASQFSIESDRTAPTVAITRNSPSSPTNADSVTFDLNFSESVSNVDSGDFDLNTSGTASGSKGATSGTSGTAVTLPVNAVAGDGALGLNVNAGTDIQDAAGNTLSTAPTSDEEFTIDNTAPTVGFDSGDPTGDDFVNDSEDNGFSVDGTASDSSGISSVTLEITDTGAGSVSPGVTGTTDWSATANVSTLGEGTITYTATAIDNAGNSNSIQITDVHDSVAPSVTVDADPTGDDFVNAAEDDSVTVTGTAADATSGIDTVTVTATGGGSVGPASTDNAANWTTTSGLNVSGLQEGTITYTATATDLAGNSNTANETDTHDSVAPNAPSTPDLDAGSDSNIDNDDITNDTTPTFSGTAEADSTVELFRAGSVSLGTGTASGGTWSITSSALSGSVLGTDHDITARATDAAGNTSASSSALTVTIDTGTTTPTIDLDAASDSGSSNTDNLTNDTTPTFSGTAEADASVRLDSSFDGNNRGTDTADGAGNWSITSVALTDGDPIGQDHAMTAFATDVAGNEATSVGLNVTIDTGTNTPTLDLRDSSDTGTFDSDDITTDNTPTFDGTGEVGATIRIDSDVDGLGVGNGTVGGGGTFAITTSALTGGTKTDHQLSAEATDVAGNTALGAFLLTVTIDDVAPANFAETLGSPNYTETLNGIVFVKSNTAISVDADDAGGTGIDTCELQIDGGGFAGYGTVSGSPASLAGDNFTLPTPDGDHDYDVRCTDVAGNASPNFSRTRRVDDTPPVISFPLGAPSHSDRWVTSNTQITIEITDGTGSGIASCTSDTTPTATVADPSDGVHTGSDDCSGFDTAGGTGDTDTTSFTFGDPRPAPNLVATTFDQDFTVAVSSVTDNLGNTADDSKLLTLDNTPPVLTKPIVPDTRTEPNEFGWNNEDVALEWRCQDPADTRNAGVAPSGVGLITASGAATGSSGASPLLVSVTSEGFNQEVTGQCFDHVDNSDDVTDSLKVAQQINVDKTAPRILFEDQTLIAENREGIVFEYPALEAVDNLSDVASEVVCTPGSETLFRVGINELTCTVSDFADNVRDRTFFIRVLPELPPGGEGTRGRVEPVPDPDDLDKDLLLFTFELFAANGDPIVFLQTEAVLWRIEVGSDGTKTETPIRSVGHYAYNRETRQYELRFDPSGLAPGTYELRSIFPWDETMWIRFEVR